MCRSGVLLPAARRTILITVNRGPVIGAAGPGRNLMDTVPGARLVQRRGSLGVPVVGALADGLVQADRRGQVLGVVSPRAPAAPRDRCATAAGTWRSMMSW
jgi:hypothetical protein